MWRCDGPGHVTDPALAETMAEHDRTVYEEDVLDVLVADLAG